MMMAWETFIEGFSKKAVTKIRKSGETPNSWRLYDFLYICSVYTNLSNNYAMAKFEITVRKNGEFQFNLKASNGEVILTSEGYTTKAACLNGAESVKKNAVEEKRFEKLVAKNGKPYFNLKATNGQIIGQSQMYASERNRNNGIASVMKNAPAAEIVEMI